LDPEHGTGRYEPLQETHRRVAEEEVRRAAGQQQPSTTTLPEPDHTQDNNSPEARLAARERELQAKVHEGRISPGEMVYQLRRFDNELASEIERGGPAPLTGRSSIETPEAARTAEPEPISSRSSDRAEDTHDPASDLSRVDSSQPVPQSQVAREAEAAEYEITGRGEMTDARAVRLERLRNIDRSIEQEHRANEGQENGPARPADGRSQ